MRPFHYVRATTVAHAIQAFATGVPSARYLAGGTTLYDLMKLNIETPSHVIDISSLPELQGIGTDSANEIVLGALTKMSDVADDPLIVDVFPVLSESLWRAASQQLRNMATVGGNLLQRTRCAYFRGGEPFACNKRSPGSGCSARDGLDRGHALLGGSDSCIAVYPGDFAVALVTLGASVEVIGLNGPRTILVEELYQEPHDKPHVESTLRPGELIVKIKVPRSPVTRASAYLKIRDRESYAFALASAAVALDMDGDTVREARISIGGLATRPWRARKAENVLKGSPLTPKAAREAGDAALEGAVSGTSNAFRIELGARTVADALTIAKQRA